MGDGCLISFSFRQYATSISHCQLARVSSFYVSNRKMIEFVFSIRLVTSYEL
jgi:hypothetical protein